MADGLCNRAAPWDGFAPCHLYAEHDGGHEHKIAPRPVSVDAVQEGTPTAERPLQSGECSAKRGHGCRKPFAYEIELGADVTRCASCLNPLNAPLPVAPAAPLQAGEAFPERSPVDPLARCACQRPGEPGYHSTGFCNPSGETRSVEAGEAVPTSAPLPDFVEDKWREWLNVLIEAGIRGHRATETREQIIGLMGDTYFALKMACDELTTARSTIQERDEEIERLRKDCLLAETVVDVATVAWQKYGATGDAEFQAMDALHTALIEYRDAMTEAR